MKRFYKSVAVAAEGDGWQVTLDGRKIRTVGGRAQVVPARALAEALAAEWDAQGEEIDPAGFILRDMADFALDAVAQNPADSIATLLPYAETDTLCYRADPEDALYRRQQAVWEPLLAGAEARWGLSFRRVSGIMHKPQPEATMAALAARLEELDAFELAALRNLASLAASLTIGLMALEDGADLSALWDAANLEEDWQAELWGKDAEAEERRAKRHEAFTSAARMVALVRAG